MGIFGYLHKLQTPKKIKMKHLKMNTISKLTKNIGILAFSCMAFTACSNDDEDIPEIINQEELITTVEIELVPKNGTQSIFLTYKDMDGNGPNEAIVTGAELAINTTYNGTITLLNESSNPAENISQEVKEEGLDHQFFYSNTLNISTSYSDKDAKGNPVGLTFELQTTEKASGSFTVVLRHEPNKTAQGVSTGNIENAGGETDILVTYPLSVN